MKDWIKLAIEQIDTCIRHKGNESLVIAIDGMSSAGKTTLGEVLQKRYGGNLFHTDDFFLQPGQRTSERMTEPGGNVDYERLKSEIIDQIRKPQGLQYGIYDCHRQEIFERVTVPYENVTIVEGCYSAHPYLGDYADIWLFLEVDANHQRERIKERNGESMLVRFLKEWIPKENEYFDVFHIREKCICIRTDLENRKEV